MAVGVGVAEDTAVRKVQQNARDTMKTITRNMVTTGLMGTTMMAMAMDTDTEDTTGTEEEVDSAIRDAVEAVGEVAGVDTVTAQTKPELVRRLRMRAWAINKTGARLVVVQTHRMPSIIHLRWCKPISVPLAVEVTVDLEAEAGSDVVGGAAEEELTLST